MRHHLGALEPALEPGLPRTDDDVAVLGQREAPVTDRERGAAAHFGQLSFAPRDLGTGHAHRLGGHCLVEDVHPAEQVAELEPPEHLTQLRAVGRAQHELGGIAVQVEIAAHRREVLRLQRLLGVLGDVLPACG